MQFLPPELNLTSRSFLRTHSWPPTDPPAAWQDLHTTSTSHFSQHGQLLEQTDHLVRGRTPTATFRARHRKQARRFLTRATSFRLASPKLLRFFFVPLGSEGLAGKHRTTNGAI